MVGNLGSDDTPKRMVALVRQHGYVVQGVQLKETVHCRAGLLLQECQGEGIRRLNDLHTRLPARLEVLGIVSQPPRSCARLYRRDRAAFRRPFADYVAKAVSMFKHRIAAWDVWNEPNDNKFYLGPRGRNM